MPDSRDNYCEIVSASDALLQAMERHFDGCLPLQIELMRAAWVATLQSLLDDTFEEKSQQLEILRKLSADRWKWRTMYLELTKTGSSEQNLTAALPELSRRTRRRISMKTIRRHPGHSQGR